MVHKKYPKIHRLEKEEVEGILDNEVLVQEKIDGANTSIWKEETFLKFGSRNNEVENFRGISEYVWNHTGIQKLLEEYPNYRLFGEWLVKHTIKYSEESWRHFYLFDIYNHEKEVWLNPNEIVELANLYNIKRPHIFGEGKFTKDELMEWVGKTVLGDKGEGVVIKSHEYRNKFGDRCYAKIVTKTFAEENKIIFGGNDKFSDCYWETYCMNEWITEARVRKVMQKIESQEDRKLELKDTPRIANTVYHDMVTEEAWTMNKKNMKLDYKTLSRLCQKKAMLLYKDLLETSYNTGTNKEGGDENNI